MAIFGQRHTENLMCMASACTAASIMYIVHVLMMLQLLHVCRPQATADSKAAEHALASSSDEDVGRAAAVSANTQTGTLESQNEHKVWCTSCFSEQFVNGTDAFILQCHPPYVSSSLCSRLLAPLSLSILLPRNARTVPTLLVLQHW